MRVPLLKNRLRSIAVALILAGVTLPAEAANTSGRSSVLDQQENQYSATTILQTASGSRVRTVKRDSFGGLYWAKDFSSSRGIFVGQVRVDGAGNVYVSLMQGATSSATPIYTLLKYTSTGALAWSRTYTDSTFFTGHPGGIALDSAGNIYMLFWGDAGFSGAPSRLLKYNPSGTRIFVKDIHPQYSTRLTSIEIDSANGIYVSGEADPGNPSTGNLLTAKYDTAGNQLWQRIDAVGPNVNPGDLALDATGQPVAAVSSSTTTASTLFVQKVTRTGTLLWNRTVPTNGFVPVGVIVDATGDVVVAGQGYGTTVGRDSTSYRVAKLEELTGALLWNTHWATPRGVLYALAEEATGTYLAVGLDASPTALQQIRVVRFDPVDGSIPATFFYNVTSDNQGFNVLPSSLAGDFYVTGLAFWSNNLFPLHWKVTGFTTAWNWITTTTFP